MNNSAKKNNPHTGRNWCDTAILATDLNGGIGFEGDLLSRHHVDTKVFQVSTTSCIVVMGRKTYESLPVKTIFRKRNTFGVVITSDPYYEVARGFVAMSMEEFMSRSVFLGILEFEFGDPSKNDIPDSTFLNTEIVLVGGATLYNQLEKLGVQKVILTTFLKNFDNVDTYVDLAQPIFLGTRQHFYKDNSIIIELCKHF